MAKFVLLYEGGGMPETEEAQAAAMKAWEDWFHEIGDAAVVDQGNPFAPASNKISADGAVSSGAGRATGYSILEADSLDDATALAKGCPVLSGGASIGVYEIFNVM